MVEKYYKAFILENEKGFKVLGMTNVIAKAIGFGTPKGCLCMHCNKIIKGDIFYIAVLNDVMDEECFHQWLNKAKRYKTDIPIEEKRFNKIRMKAIQAIWDSYNKKL